MYSQSLNNLLSKKSLFHTFRNLLFGIIFLGYTLICQAEELELGGFVVDQTISRVGHLFYDALVNNWEIPKDIGVITVRERPNAFTGNVVWVEINGIVVFSNRMGTRAAGIEEKALAVRQIIIAYNEQQKDGLQADFY